MTESRKRARTGLRRQGFTILELLTVVAIMGIIMGAGVASFVQLRRGAEIRGAESVMRSTLALARQHAVTKRRPTIVVFRQDPTNSTLYVFEQAGTADAGGSRTVLRARDVNWSGLNHSNKWVCNMGSGAIGRIQTHDWSTATLFAPGLDLSGSSWQAGDRYAWQINETAYLPPGIEFETDPLPLVVFRPNGTAGSAATTQDVVFREKLDPTKKRRLTLYTLTGLILVKDG